MQLNEEQLAVVNANRGRYAVRASPGSGKTACLVARTVRLLEQGESFDDILVLSFTAEAARNLRTRVDKCIDVPPSTRLSGLITFHSFGLSFCTREHENFPFPLADNPLATEGQCAKIGYEIAAKHSVNYKAMRSWISLQKRNRITSTQALKAAEKTNDGQALALAYKKYDEALAKICCLDFDSLLLETVNLLESRPDIRSRYQYEWCMADEAQDCDPIQFRLLELLTERYGNLILVGDERQNIFRWRGSDASFFQSVGFQQLYLSTNFRSTKKIVEYIKQIAPNKCEALERFTTDNEEGVEPEITMYSVPQREAEEVVQKIQKLEGSTAVLCRTNMGLRPVEDALIDANMKYHYLGDSGFYNRPEVKNVISYLQCCVGITDSSVLGALRSPFHPSKYIKKKQLVDEIKAQKGTDQTAWQLLVSNPNQAIQGFVKFIRSLTTYRYLPAKDAVGYILRDLKAFDYYHEEEALQADNNPVDNLKELHRVAAKYSDLRSFLDFIRRVQAASRRKKGVVLSTGHSAKGREWANVFVIQCCEGMIPHKRSTDMEEEANLLYVMASRAEKTLHISYTGLPSRFLGLEKDILDF